VQDGSELPPYEPTPVRIGIRDFKEVMVVMSCLFKLATPPCLVCSIALFVTLAMPDASAAQDLATLSQTAMLFSRPNTQSMAIETLRTGTQVQVLPTLVDDPAWVRVTVHGGVFPRVGYVSSESLSQPAAPIQPTVASQTVRPIEKVVTPAPMIPPSPPEFGGSGPVVDSIAIGPTTTSGSLFLVAPNVRPPADVEPLIATSPSVAVVAPESAFAISATPVAIASDSKELTTPPALSAAPSAYMATTPNVAPPADTASMRSPMPPAVGAPVLLDLRAALARGQQLRGDFAGLNLSDTGQSIFNVIGAVAASANGGAVATKSGFSLRVFTPQSWITQIASDAAKEYRELDETLFQTADFEPVLRVIVDPDTPSHITASGMAGTSSVRHVVIRDAQRKIVIQPVLLEPWTTELSNATGGRVGYVGLQAQFRLADFQRLRGSGDQEFFITVIGTSGAEKDFKVKKKHFERLPIK
jgi:hypothetical protein